MQSWSKPEGIENIIAIKKVDPSVFSPGSIYISRKFKSDFVEANGGVELKDHDVETIILLIDGKEYPADLRCNYSPNTKGIKKENLQIRYDGNTILKNLLSNRFQYSYKYIISEQQRNGKTSLNFPIVWQNI